MRIIAVSRPDSEHRHEFESFLLEFHSRTGRQVELINPDTTDGVDFCRLYEIIEYPAIICLSADGVVAGKWTASNLPSIGELAVLIES